MTTPMKPPVNVGDVIHVGEPDYKFGVGPLHLRVTDVGGVEREADGPWVNLRGVELWSDGREKKSEPRWALVRVRALIGQPKPPGAKP
jgi:hypothetical protein